MVKGAERFQDYEYDHEAEDRYRGGMAGRILGVAAILALATLAIGLVLKHQTVIYSGVGTFVGLILIGFAFTNRRPNCSRCGQSMLRATLPVSKDTRKWYDRVQTVTSSDDRETYTYDDRAYFRTRIQLFHCRSCKTLFVARKRIHQKVEDGEEGIERQKNFHKKIDKLKREGKLRPPGQ